MGKLKKSDKRSFQTNKPERHTNRGQTWNGKHGTKLPVISFHLTTQMCYLSQLQKGMNNVIDPITSGTSDQDATTH